MRSTARPVAELDRRPLRRAAVVEPVERPLLPAVLPAQERVDAGVVDHTRGCRHAFATLFPAEVRRSQEHIRIATNAAHLPRLRRAPDEQALAVVADDPDRGGDGRTVSLEGSQADVAPVLEITDGIHRIRMSVHRILGQWQVSISRPSSMQPYRSPTMPAWMRSAFGASLLGSKSRRWRCTATSR